MAAVTRLGLYGGPRGLYGSFAGKEEQVIVEVEAPQGGGGSYRRSKYPRRVSIGGVLYWVNSAEEERELLRRHLEALEREALEAALEEKPKAVVAKAKVKVVRAQRRLEKVDDRESAWLARLREEDEEILAIVLH